MKGWAIRRIGGGFILTRDVLATTLEVYTKREEADLIVRTAYKGTGEVVPVEVTLDKSEGR